MKAIQFGAGNIGRGFIGAVLAKSGCELVFADVVQELIDQINSRGEYTVHVSDVNSYDFDVTGVRAVNSGSEAIVDEIATADIVTTAVGLRILKFVAPSIAKGIQARMKAGNRNWLNVIACENGLKASGQLKELTYSHLDDNAKAWADKYVGWTDAAVDRIVPPVRCEIPLDVAVEEWLEWDVERAAFAGPVPQIEGMTVVDNMLAYVERKLFTLNTGHATAAYLGKLKGIETIGECVADPQIKAAVKAAMQQSGEGLIAKFGFDHDAHYAYIEKILARFSNPFLKDECNRVGREPIRKLAPNDRLILPMLTAKKYGLPYDNLIVSIAAALHFNNPDDPQSVELQANIAKEGLEASIVKYTGIEPTDPLIKEITDAYLKLS